MQPSEDALRQRPFARELGQGVAQGRRCRRELDYSACDAQYSHDNTHRTDFHSYAAADD